MTVPSWANQLVPQLLKKQNNTLPNIEDAFDIYMKMFDADKTVFEKNHTFVNL